MRQQLVKNLLFVLFVNVLVKAAWIFLIDRNVQIKVGYEQYGAFQALFNLGMIFQIVLDFGLTQYTSKAVASDHKKIGDLFSSMFWARILLSIVYFLLVLGVAVALGYSQLQISLLMAVLSILTLNSMMVFLRSNVAALHYFKVDGLLAVVDRLLMIAICGALLFIPQWSANFKIEWFVWSQIISYAVAILVAFFVLFRITPVSIHFSFHPQTIKHVLRQSAPYALLVFLMSIYMRADSVMIERLCGAQGKMQAGIYASAFRLLDVANIFGVMFAGMLMPIFSKMFSEKQSIASTVRTAVNIMMPISFIASVIALFFGNEIMELLYHKASTGNDGLLFAILMASFPAYCLMYIYSTLLTANGSIHLLNKISIVIVLFSLLSHYFLISNYQALGAAFTVLLTEWLVAAIVIFFAHRKCALPHNFRWLAGHVFFLICVLLFGFFVTKINFSWQVQFLLLTIAAVILLFIFRFWRIANIKELLSKKSDN